MNLLSFLRDRLSYIIIYFVGSGLTVLVIELDLFQSGLFLHSQNIFYIFVLSLTVLVLFLAIDYLRQLPFYREMRKAGDRLTFEHVLKIEDAVTAEQKIMMQLIHGQYRRYMMELVQYEESKKRHLHFTNQWVHGMKTPVSVIHLLVQQGGGVRDIGEAEALLKSIGEENERLSHGLEMILHTARLENFEFDVAIKRLDLVELVRSAIHDHKKSMIRQAIYPKLVSVKEPVYVETDRKWMTFIIHQLTTNAIKYSAKGQNRKILYEIEGNRGACRLQVKDEGVGIPQQDLPRVFDPFFTGENGRHRSESTGMGLYLTKEVCTRLGHKVSVSSQEGQGTTVTITFSNESIYRL